MVIKKSVATINNSMSFQEAVLKSYLKSKLGKIRNINIDDIMAKIKSGAISIEELKNMVEKAPAKDYEEWYAQFRKSL